MPVTAHPYKDFFGLFCGIFSLSAVDCGSGRANSGYCQKGKPQRGIAVIAGVRGTGLSCGFRIGVGEVHIIRNFGGHHNCLLRYYYSVFSMYFQ